MRRAVAALPEIAGFVSPLDVCRAGERRLRQPSTDSALTYS